MRREDSRSHPKFLDFQTLEDLEFHGWIDQVVRGRLSFGRFAWDLVCPSAVGMVRKQI